MTKEQVNAFLQDLSKHLSLDVEFDLNKTTTMVMVIEGSSPSGADSKINVFFDYYEQSDVLFIYSLSEKKLPTEPKEKDRLMTGLLRANLFNILNFGRIGVTTDNDVLISFAFPGLFLTSEFVPMFNEHCLGVLHAWQDWTHQIDGILSAGL